MTSALDGGRSDGGVVAASAAATPANLLVVAALAHFAVGQQLSSALAGKATVDQALKAAQVAADREMKKGGYYK